MSPAKVLGPRGEPGLLPGYRRLASHHLTAALPLGLQVRRCEEPRLPDEDDLQTLASDIAVGPREDWPWSLHDFVPEAASAACTRTPATIIWHFRQLGTAGDHVTEQPYAPVGDSLDARDWAALCHSCLLSYEEAHHTSDWCRHVCRDLVDLYLGKQLVSGDGGAVTDEPGSQDSLRVRSFLRKCGKRHDGHPATAARTAFSILSWRGRTAYSSACA